MICHKPFTVSFTCFSIFIGCVNFSIVMSDLYVLLFDWIEAFDVLIPLDSLPAFYKSLFPSITALSCARLPNFKERWSLLLFNELCF